MADELPPPNDLPPPGDSSGNNGNPSEPLRIEDELKVSYLNYAMSVIISRALPDVRDGLKPSQRRILVAMNDLGLGPASSTSKCAGIVGETMKRYHPHGDGAIYPTLVRMAQEWNMRHLLIRGQGNFGSIAGLPPAAMRYTEARLSPVAAEMLEDLERDTVDFMDNYDGKYREPLVLPCKFPNLLVNGSDGIAVGMATEIPPHNLREICDGVIRLIDDPDVTIDQLLRMTSGIDFDEESTAGAALYYSTDLRHRIYGYDVKWPPGQHYLYGSVSTQILWDVLDRRLGDETVAQYFAERVWSPLGAEQPAAWSLDSASSGVEKLFGGFSATARDHARLGLLFLHGGALNGQAIVPASWVARSLEPDAVAGLVHTADGYVRRGHYQWFLTRDGRSYFAKGYNGQYVFVVPDRRAVFVRFGEGYGDVDWTALFARLADEL